jgi:hypothetical protein
VERSIREEGSVLVLESMNTRNGVCKTTGNAWGHGNKYIN